MFSVGAVKKCEFTTDFVLDH